MLRTFDLFVVLVCGVIAYYFSSAYATNSAAGVSSIPESYIKVILLAVVFAVPALQCLSCLAWFLYAY